MTMLKYIYIAITVLFTPFCPDLTKHYLNIMVKKYFDDEK